MQQGPGTYYTTVIMKIEGELNHSRSYKVWDAGSGLRVSYPRVQTVPPLHVACRIRALSKPKQGLLFSRQPHLVCMLLMGDGLHQSQDVMPKRRWHFTRDWIPCKGKKNQRYLFEGAHNKQYSIWNFGGSLFYGKYPMAAEN